MTSRGRASAGLDILEPEQLVVPRPSSLSAYMGAVAMGGNGFVAAFVGGLLFGASARHGCRSRSSSARRWGCSPPSSSGPCSERSSWVQWSRAISSPSRSPLRIDVDLTVVRMLPVAAALTGVGLRRDTVAFMGWFGRVVSPSVVFTDRLRGPPRRGPHRRCHRGDRHVDDALGGGPRSLGGPSHRHTATACTRRATSQSSPRLPAADPEEVSLTDPPWRMNHPHRMMPGRRRART